MIFRTRTGLNVASSQLNVISAEPDVVHRLVCRVNAPMKVIIQKAASTKATKVIAKVDHNDALVSVLGGLFPIEGEPSWFSASASSIESKGRK